MSEDNFISVDELIVVLQGLSAKGYGSAGVGVAGEFGITRREPVVDTRDWFGVSLKRPWVEFEGEA